MDMTTEVPETRVKEEALERLVPIFVVAGIILVVLPLALFLGARLLLPGDGTRVVLDLARAKGSGLTVRPLTPRPDSLRIDDIVVAVEGRAIHAWLKDTLVAQWNNAQPGGNALLQYTVARSSGNVVVPVRLGPFPLAQALTPGWSVFVFLAYLLLVSVFVVARRPHLPSARMFVLVAAVMFANGVIFNLGLQVSDLLRGWPAALWLWGAVGMCGLMMATILHFTMVFPRRLPLLINHRAVLIPVYAGAWVFYGAFLFLRWPSAVSYVERFLLLLRGTTVFMVAYILLMLLTWFYSYRTSQSPADQRQLRWMIWGMAVALIPFMGLSLIPSAFGTGAPLGSNFGVVGLFLCAIPTAMTSAILRERLFDIDVIMNRTLVYGTLSGLLALIYFGSVLVLTEVVHTFTAGTRQDLVVVVATLTSAGVFQPLRRRVQALIDRRFFRSKYDAARTLQAFSARVRVEVDLQQLTANLVAVVDETMQPEHVSLWLPKLDRSQRT